MHYILIWLLTWRSGIFRRNAFTLYDKIESLNAELVIPNLQRLDAVFEQISAGKWEALDLESWIMKSLAETISEEDLVQCLSRLQDEGASVFGLKVRGVKSATVDDVRAIPDGRVLVSATALVEVEISISVNWGDYLNSAEIRSVVGESDEPFEWLMTEDFLDVHAKFSLVVDPKERAAVSAQIDEIEGDAGAVTLYPHPYRDE